MRSLVKYAIISFVFVSFMMLGNMNQVEASEVIQNESEKLIPLLTVSSVVNIDGKPTIYYIDDSDYSVLFKIAVSAWNQYGVVYIIENQEEYSLKIINEELGYNGIVAQYINTSQSSYILINDTYFKDLTSEEKLYVLTHEIGHALGLNDIQNDSEYASIMSQEINSSNTITYYDILNLMEFINSNNDEFNVNPVTYYLCFASANDGIDGASCVGPGGGGGSTSITNYTIEDRIRIYFSYLNNDNYHYVIDTYNDFIYDEWFTGVELVVGVVLVLIPEPTTSVAGGIQVTQIIGTVLLGTDIGMYIYESQVPDPGWKSVTFYSETNNFIRTFWVEYYYHDGTEIVVDVRFTRPFGLTQD